MAGKRKIGNEGPGCRRRRQDGGSGWRLLRRLREARKSERIPPRPSFSPEPKRQAQGCCRDPGARRQFGPGGIQYGKPSRFLHSFVPGSPRARSSTPTKRRLGTTCMSVSRSRESIIRRHTASMALVLTWLRNTSPASDALRSASTTTSRGRISSATRKSLHGGKTTAASRMGIR
jgi:hypothetical protein